MIQELMIKRCGGIEDIMLLIGAEAIMTINYKEIPFSEVEQLRPLWEKLRIHHYERASDFKNDFATTTFEQRQQKLMKNKKAIKIYVAEETSLGRIIGYCIASLHEDHRGEIDSIYIEAEYRKLGIGRTLMERSLEWFAAVGVTEILIEVAVGNEAALPFYRQFGFAPRTYLLKRKPV